MDALAAGDADVAVHSLKDLPTAPTTRVLLAAVPRARTPATPWSHATASPWASCPRAHRSAPARPAGLHSCEALGLGCTRRRDARQRGHPVWRGGASGAVDAVVLARAGLAASDGQREITETIDPIQMLPAPGQGALAVEVAARETGLAETSGRLWTIPTAGQRSWPSARC